MFETAISYKGLLDGIILLCDELTDGHRHTFLFGVGASAVQFDVESADH